jgi:hypothetical protein
MQRDVIIADGFYEDPDAVARYGRSLAYCAPYNEPGDEARGRAIHWRSSLFRSGIDCPFKSSSSLIAKLEFLVGEQINMDHWYAAFPVGNDGLPRPGFEGSRRTAWWNCCFHAKHHHQERGEGVHNYAEADPWNSVGAMGWSGLVFLSKTDPIPAGVMTWRNRHGRRDERFSPKENWELVDEYAYAYNRLVLLRGWVPRSTAGGWGATVADGAFFQTFFFTTTLTDATPSVSLHDVPVPYRLIERLRIGAQPTDATS